MGAQMKTSKQVYRPKPELQLVQSEKQKIREVWKKLWFGIEIPFTVAQAVNELILARRTIRVIENSHKNYRFEEFNPREEYLKKTHII